jgi:uncharacterized protein (TIGR01777 family)
MTDQTFETTSRIPASAQELYDWHARPGAFARLTPPWQRVRLRAGSTGLCEGSRVVLELKSGPFHRTWVAEHRNVRPGLGFQDIQLEGPFARWEHTHDFAPLGDKHSELRDSITYRLPAGVLGNLAGSDFVRHQLKRAFTYRHDTTADDLRLFVRFRDLPRLRVAVTGGSGFIGTALTHLLTTHGHTVVPMARAARIESPSLPTWNSDDGVLNPETLEGIDAVVHLAGESVSQGRWNQAKKRRIRSSREQGTARLVTSLMELRQPPKVLVSASAIGFYGPRDDEILDERSGRGTGFLADVAQSWESTARVAAEAGIRVVNSRFGVVLSPTGRALAKMLPLFKVGAGGVIGSGSQAVSWISLDDAIAALLHSLMCPDLEGPVNLTAPSPVDNRELTKVLARVLRRPALARVPSLAARVAFGEMADEMLLTGSRVVPNQLLGSGFEFRHPDLETALRHLLGRTDATG